MQSPIRGFESGSDNDSEYLQSSIDPMKLQQSTFSNANDPSQELYFKFCDVVETRMDRRGMKRAILLNYSDIQEYLIPFPSVVAAFRPINLQATLNATELKPNTEITATMFETIITNIELGNEEEQFGMINESQNLDDSLLDSYGEPKEVNGFNREEHNQSVVSWVTTDDEGELLYRDDDVQNLDDLNNANRTPSALKNTTPATDLTNDEEALAKAVVDIVDARLRAGFEERDRAIVAVQSTLTSFAEILKNQEEMHEEMMYTERGHPLVPSRALTPGPVLPTPPPPDFKKRTRKRQRRKFGPSIFKKPQPVILALSNNGIASLVDVGTATATEKTTNTKSLLSIRTNEINTTTLTTTTTASPMGKSSVALAASMTPMELAAIKKKNLAKNQARAAEISQAGLKLPAYGSIVFPPSDYHAGMNADELAPPTADLNVEWVFGYGGGGGSSTINRKLPQPGAELQELQSGEIAFHAGSLVIMFDCTLRTQRFFQGHNDLITSMAVHPGKVIVASGQRGKIHGTICIWDSGANPPEWSPKKKIETNETNDENVEPILLKTMELTRLLIPKSSAGMSTMDFNEKGELLAIVTAVGNGTSGGAMLQVWDWRNSTMLVR